MSLEEKVKEVVNRNINKADVDIQPATTFEDLGANYLDIVQIATELEDNYDIEITDEELQRVQNMGDLVFCVKRRIAMGNLISRVEREIVEGDDS